MTSLGFQWELCNHRHPLAFAFFKFCLYLQCVFLLLFSLILSLHLIRLYFAILECLALHNHSLGLASLATVGNCTFMAALDAGCASAGCARTRRPQLLTYAPVKGRAS